MPLSAAAIARLKSQLVTSGLNQKNQPLYQVINQLIDFVTQLQQDVFGTQGTSGVIPSSTPGISGATFLTIDDETAILPNSRQLNPGQDIEFNDRLTGRRFVSARVPLTVNDHESQDGFDGLPGRDGRDGIQGPAGMDGIDASEDIFLIPPAINDYDGPYAEFTDTTNQTPLVTTPVKVTFNTTGLISGFTISGGGDITALEAGNYLIIFTGQIGETANGNVNIDCWFRVNGTDVVNSNNRNFVTATTDTKIMTVDAIHRLEKNDVFNVYMSVNNATRGAGFISIAPVGEPVIPSAMVLIHKVSK